MTAYVLIHSPLVGPMTWALVADELRRLNDSAVVPALFAVPDPSAPYWQQHAQVVAQTVAREAPDDPLILVGHSGGGMLLPAIRQAIGRPVQGYLFADAGLPQNGFSRFDLFDSPEDVAEFRAAAVGGTLTPWTQDDLRRVIPENEIRESFVADMRPMPLAVYEEPIPVFKGWPDAPCGYLQFSAVYDGPAQQARESGWPYLHLSGGHFHMLVAPADVAHALLTLASQI